MSIRTAATRSPKSHSKVAISHRKGASPKWPTNLCSGDDSLVGDIQDNQLFGGAGDDTLDGAAGSDFGALLPLVRPGGRVVSYGGTAGPSVTFPIRYHFWNQLQLIGSTMGSPSDFAEMISFVKTHELKPVIHSISALAEGASLISSMETSGQFGKLVMEIS